MYHFRNDYSEGAHPRVLEALIRTNLESTAGYGEDAYCAAAAAARRGDAGKPDKRFVPKSSKKSTRKFRITTKSR